MMMADRNTNPNAGRLALLAEVRFELATMRTTQYQHDTDVDVSIGQFFYDCSGLVDYALGVARRSAVEALPISRPDAGRPLAEDYEHYLRLADGGIGDGAWEPVIKVAALLPGDVIAWLVTPDSESRDTGHVLVVLERPRPNPRHPGEWLIQIADSTTMPHADDSRVGYDGLGTGLIGLDVDDFGRPSGFFWRGGETESPTPTKVALGRPC